MRESIIKLYRSTVLVMLFILFGLGALFIRYFIFPFQKSRFENYETLQSSWKIFVLLLVKSGLISIQIDDIERLKNIKNSIIVSTHPSFIDIVILMSIIPHSTCFVAERLANNPFLKGMVSLLFILEGQEMDMWVQESARMLKSGLNIIVFPMGIRHRKNEFPRIRRGAALIAEASKKNIVMLRLEQSYDFLYIHQPFYDAGNRIVEYNLEYLGEIDTQKHLEKYSEDVVSFKTEITKIITKTLYKNKNSSL